MVLVTLLTALLAYKGSQMVAPDGIIVLPGRKRNRWIYENQRPIWSKRDIWDPTLAGYPNHFFVEIRTIITKSQSSSPVSGSITGVLFQWPIASHLFRRKTLKEKSKQSRNLQLYSSNTVYWGILGRTNDYIMKQERTLKQVTPQ